MRRSLVASHVWTVRIERKYQIVLPNPYTMFYYEHARVDLVYPIDLSYQRNISVSDESIHERLIIGEWYDIAYKVDPNIGSEMWISATINSRASKLSLLGTYLPRDICTIIIDLAFPAKPTH